MINDSIKIRGHYKATECDPTKAPLEYEALVAFVRSSPIAALIGEQEKQAHAAKYAELMSAYVAKAKVRIVEWDNLVPTAGQSVIAQRLANTTTYTGIVNYVALGDAATTPTIGDTQLGNETYRATLSSQTYVNNIAYLSCFIAAGSATGTHYEGGLFIDGTGSANTGQLFSHVLFSPAIAKTALNSLTLDITLTVS